jgi:hypothetical protein
MRQQERLFETMLDHSFVQHAFDRVRPLTEEERSEVASRVERDFIRPGSKGAPRSRAVQPQTSGAAAEREFLARCREEGAAYLLTDGLSPILHGALRATTEDSRPHCEWVVVDERIRWAMFFEYADEGNTAFVWNPRLDPMDMER